MKTGEVIQADIVKLMAFVFGAVSLVQKYGISVNPAVLAIANDPQVVSAVSIGLAWLVIWWRRSPWGRLASLVGHSAENIVEARLRALERKYGADREDPVVPPNRTLV